MIVASLRRVLPVDTSSAASRRHLLLAPAVSLLGVAVAVALVAVPPAHAATARAGLPSGARSATVPTGTPSLPTASPTSTATPQPTGWVPPAGASFNTPRSTPTAEYRNEARVIDAINHAKWGSTIRMVMFSFDRKQVSDALIRAYDKRNVAVQVITNDHERPGAQSDLLRVLGHRYKHLKVRPGNPTNRKRRLSYYFQCTSSCRGDFDVQHSKFVLFSKTGAAQKVVMVGSLNMKENGAVNQWNDLLTINDSPRLYDSLVTTMDEMKRDKVLQNPLKHQVFGKYELWTLPFARQTATARTKWTPARDPIMKMLSHVSCTGASTPSGRTVLRVDMHAWDGNRGLVLAQRFRDLYQRGCDVKIMVGFAGGRTRQVFGHRTTRGFVPVRSTGYDTDGDLEIDLYSHKKILLIDGSYNGHPGKKLVVTGSSNYQDGGQYGDELILKVDSGALYKQYIANWDSVYRNNTHGFAFNNGAYRTGVSGRRTVTAKPFIYDGLGIDSPEWRDE